MIPLDAMFMGIGFVATGIAFVSAIEADNVTNEDNVTNDSGVPSEYNMPHIPVENSKFFKQMFLHGNTLCAPSAFFKREIVSLLGEFDESLIHLQDYDYWLKALSNDLTFTFHNKRLVFYRRHPNNLSSKENSSKSLNETKTNEPNNILDDFLIFPLVIPNLSTLS